VQLLEPERAALLGGCGLHEIRGAGGFWLSFKAILENDLQKQAFPRNYHHAPRFS
jgi:hypothetical protein